MISELKTFIAVCRHGTFVAAGERIGLTQSAVSSQIKRLEDSLGFPLFDRTGRSATLNAAGETTLARAVEICALYDRLGEPPAGDEAEGGLLRIGAIASTQSTLLARALAKLRKATPSLRVHVSPGVSMRLMDDLDAGTIDAALIIRPPFGMPPELRWQTLVRERYVLAAPKALPGRDWRRLLQEQPFLRYDRASFGGRMVERFLRREGITVNESIEVDEIPGLIHMAAKGLGVALVPMVEAHLPLPAGVRTVSLGQATFHREVGLLQRAPQSSPAVVGRLAQCLQEAVRKGSTAQG
jgi:DNA-binding transcriptional LysR family regulator